MNKKDLEVDLFRMQHLALKLQSFIRKLGLENEFINTLDEDEKWFYETQLEIGRSIFEKMDKSLKDITKVR